MRGVHGLEGHARAVAGVADDHHRAPVLARGLVGQKWESRAGKIGTAAAAGEHHVWVIADYLELFLCFQIDDSLMQAVNFFPCRTTLVTVR